MKNTAIWMHVEAHRQDLHDDLIAEYAGLSRKVAQMVADIEAARTSPMLTEAGWLDAVQRRKEQARTELLPALQARLSKIDGRLQQLTEQALAPRAKDTTRHFQEFEIRQAIRGNDPLQNEIILMDAIDAGDWLTVAAIEDAPPFFKLITPEMRQRATEQKIAKSPMAAEIEQVQRDRDVHTSLLQAAVHDIETAGLSGPPGPAARPSGAPAPALNEG